jgi:hypothetical protein
MQRAQESYLQARYEDSLTWLTDLEDDAPSMDPELRARYFYLRGMTEYRLGHRANALHYLAVAREVAGERGEGLLEDWVPLLDRTLEELTPRAPMSHQPPEPTRASAGEATSGGESAR